MRALGNRNFALGCVLSFVTGVGIFTTIYLTPLFLGYVRGFSAWQTGTAIFSTGAASLLGTPVYILLARRFDTRWLMMAGLACFGLSMWSFSFITHDWGAAELLVPQILRGFPQVFAVAPSVNLGLGSLPPERLKYASGLFNMMRNLGGAIGTAALETFFTKREQFHSAIITPEVSLLAPATRTRLAELQQYFMTHGFPDPDGAMHRAIIAVGQTIRAQATIMGYADCFGLIGAVLLAAVGAVAMLRKGTSAGGAAR
jgi:DHA2 family multidrug resistance protein